ncbi:RHS repeat-associated core domain-containing protein [Kosakonia sp. YIM B13605]|uniref:RHS repeat-associated core domain-containing protein n=1 Tax=Kosakonia TaxID=1330547 RepID=UPI0028A656A7|nr:RHS repeat-associated core domain-containing protein [Kosakonia sacchari]
MSTSLFSKTPTVTVLDNRGLTVRTLAYHRHPDSPDVTDERITRHQYSLPGNLTRSADPRLHDAGLANFTLLTDLAGAVLRTVSADAGTTISLNDAAGRPFTVVSDISTDSNGTEDRSQTVTRRWQYEDASLPGRLLAVTDQVTGGAARVTERFIYAGGSSAEKNLNLAGQCISHYDTAGLVQTDSIAVTGTTLSVTRHLLKDADNPDTPADWQGADASAWNDLLDGGTYITLSTADATGAVLTTTDAAGNIRSVAYDVAGQLSGRWLELKDSGIRQVILKSVTWSAAGQKLREEHGNGVVTTWTYEPETQRLIGMKTERPAGHAAGAKVLQDLRYAWDPVGNVLNVTNDAEETRFWRNQKVVPENTYAYDSLYQMVSATGREMASAGQQSSNAPSLAVPLPADSSAYTGYTRTYHYDRAGNLTQLRHSAPATNHSYTTDITVSDKSNRGVLSTLTENAADVDALFTAGGQQKLLQPGQELVWTPRNELLKVTPVVREGDTADRESYRYDAGSLRILKVSVQKSGNSTQTQRVVYLPGLELRSTANGSSETESLHIITAGRAGRAQVRVLHWVSGKPDGIADDMLRYSYDDLTRNSLLELDGDGNVISNEEYYPYGGTAVWTARSAVEAEYKTIRYSGKERDATGLYYYGYRYYQPWAGRWLSADPAGTVDGLNLFRMVRNNPITNHDVMGLSPIEGIPLSSVTEKRITAAQEGTHANRAREVKRAYEYIENKYQRAVPSTQIIKGQKRPLTSSEHIIPNNLLIAGAPREFKRYANISPHYDMDKGSGFIEGQAVAYQENDIAHKAHSGTGTKGVIKNPDATNDNATYLSTVKSLLHSGDVSSAIQINQLGYAHSPVFRDLRNIRSKSRFNEWAVNVVADNSFFHSVGAIKSMPFVANEPWDRESRTFTEEPQINSIEITVQDKFEGAISRMAAVMERYPTVAELKKFIKKYNYEIPEGYSWLSSEIIEWDTKTPYYML